MKKQGLVGLIGLMFCMSSWAEVVLDVYGTNQKEAEQILKQYGKDVSTIMQRVQSAIVEEKKDDIDANTKKLKRQVQAQIKKQYGFLFVDFEMTLYPPKKDLYTTIEVIPKDKPALMSYVNQEPTHSKSNEPEKNDLINKMIEFNETISQLMIKHELNPAGIPCPVYHCIVTFDQPKLKPYLAIFNQGAIKEKKLILDTLKNDPDQERRAAAVFLIGHWKDPKEIITVLMPYTQDKSGDVRNNAMRVVAITMDKAKIYDVDLKPILALLESPLGEDRNKALAIVSAAAKSPANRNTILQLGGENIVQLLALKQINNHAFAYVILKDLSGKDLGEYNIAAWQKWVTEARTNSKA
jgi:hypothetical protein